MHITKHLTHALLAAGTIITPLFVAAPMASALDGNDRCLVWTSYVTSSHYTGDGEVTNIETRCSVSEKTGPWAPPPKGPTDPEPQQSEVPKGASPGDRELTCESLAAHLNEFEDALRWAQDNIQQLEADVADAQLKSDAAWVAYWDADAAYQRAVAAVAAAKDAYPGDLEFYVVQRNGYENRISVNVDISIPEGKALVNALKAQADALNTRNAAYPAMSFGPGSVHARNAELLANARMILANYGRDIEDLRRQYDRICR